MLLLAAVIQASSFTVSTPAKDAAILAWQRKQVLVARGTALNPEQVAHSEKAEPLHLGYPHGPQTAQFVPPGRERETYTVKLGAFKGRIIGSLDAMLCSDDPESTLGSTFGRPTVETANGVYDRAGDWLITFEGPSVGIKPVGKTGYEVHSMGPCTVRFRPNYYRDHLGYFLWDRTKPLWKEPVAGWCSWMAHLQEVREVDVVEAAKFFAANLKEYGYDVIQIDDGFQRALQFGQETAGNEPFSSYWTKPNIKFPQGMEKLAHQIKSLGLTPGVWIGYYLPLGLKNSKAYVTGQDGKPHKGPWVNYAVNGLDNKARQEGYIDTVKEFKRQGWDYFKIDTLRHVLYDSYRQVPDYWKARNESMEEAYRRILSETKKAAGSSYVLACWGTIPELAGLSDGARIGEDVGPDFESMRRSAKYIAQFHYLNNVVWRNDPDYMCFRVPIEQARTWATLTFMAGGHLMVSNKVSEYDAPHLDALRRVGPPIFTRPTNVVAHKPDPEYLTLTSEKNGEEWRVVARFAWQDLPAWKPTQTTLGGLRRKYLAFDFWEEKFLGLVEDAPFRALPKGSCQVISLRTALDRPQLLGTNRHMSQGAHELENVTWTQKKLAGRFKRGPGQAWSIYLHIPEGWSATNVLPTSLKTEHSPGVLKLTFPVGPEPMDWQVSFKKW